VASGGYEMVAQWVFIEINVDGSVMEWDGDRSGPQCGFASTEEGNNLAEDDQWRKLEMIVAISRDVWK
jgi:hypothetical protein